jgi:hypothetical protein
VHRCIFQFRRNNLICADAPFGVDRARNRVRDVVASGPGDPVMLWSSMFLRVIHGGLRKVHLDGVGVRTLRGMCLYIAAVFRRGVFQMI